MNGAAHVHVDDRDAAAFEDDGGVPKLRWFFPEELDGEGAVGGAGFDKFMRAPVAIDEGPGIDKIRGAESHPADFADHEAKGQVGVTG